MRTGFQLGVTRAKDGTGTAIPPIARALLIAGTNGRTGDGSYTISASSGATEIKDRTPHILGFACSTITLSLHNWFCTPGGEQTPSGEARIFKAAIEWQGVGTAPLTFGGQRGATVAPDAFERRADEIGPAAFGSPLAAFPRDATFYVTIIYSADPGTSVATGVPCKMTGSTSPAPNGTCRLWVYDPANRIDDVDGAGAKATPAGSQEPSGFALPRFLLGRPVDADPLSVLMVGDSISVGLNSPTNPCARLTGFGFADHAAIDPATHDGAIAMGHSGRQGETLNNWMQSNARRRQMLARCTVVLLQHGCNDIGMSGQGPTVAFDGQSKGSPLDNLRFNYAAFHALARSFPSVRRVYQTRLMPRASASSDAFRSAAGQTVQPGWAAGGFRDQLELWWQAQVASGVLDGLIDTRTPVADPADDHLWGSDPATANWLTSDGVHPVAAGHARAAVPLRQALLSAFD